MATLPFGSAQAQDILILSVNKASVPQSVASSVTFQLSISANSNLIATSVNLQRLSGATWIDVGRLYNDGTHGDVTANDNIFTTQLSLNEASLGSVTFRASAAYKGKIQRVVSNMATIAIAPPLGLEIQAGASSLTIVQGQTTNVAFVINLSNVGFGNLNVRNVISVAPAGGGVSVTSDYPSGGYFSSASNSFVLNEKFSGNQLGSYVVTNTASIQGKSVTSVASVIVNVVAAGSSAAVLPVGAFPDGVQLNVPTMVTFTATTANDSAAPTRLSLRRGVGPNAPIVAELLDNGLNDDLSAGDRVYTGTILVNESVEGGVPFVASAIFPGVSGERFSPPFSLAIGCHPTGLRPANLSKVVKDPIKGESFLSNEVLVTFVSAARCTDKNQVAATRVAGAIVGTQPGLGLHQIDISAFNAGGTVQGVYNAIAALLSDQRVLSAEPNFVGVTTTEWTPNDPGLAAGPATQYAPQKIRADEAWVIARGGPVIAVVDTGVNYNHEDLSGKVIKGSDFIAPDADPMDEGDHGTHVAGIAAASTNNGKGIAGIAPDSKILAIRAIGGTYAAMAAGIKYAADKGAKIINISGGGTVDNTAVRDAVKYAVAKGALIVSTPANLSQVSAGAKFYPGAYPEVFCVGATTASDTRYSGSNFGDYVDIAAPGSSIYSTLQSGGYGFKSGVSQAAPVVSGAAAALWSRYPSWTAAQIRERLEKTAVPLPGLGLGAGRIDLFEAVFNGSFEDGMNGWDVSGTAGAVANLGPLIPPDRTKFGFASSGPDSSVVETSLSQSFTIQPGVTEFKIQFDYNFVTEEYPEFVGSIFDDNLRIVLLAPNGTETLLAFESVNSSKFTLVSGIDFPGGDTTVGQTGWKTVKRTVPITAGPGKYTIRIRDEGDGIYDSNVLIDRIRFKITP